MAAAAGLVDRLLRHLRVAAVRGFLALAARHLVQRRERQARTAELLAALVRRAQRRLTLAARAVAERLLRALRVRRALRLLWAVAGVAQAAESQQLLLMLLAAQEGNLVRHLWMPRQAARPQALSTATLAGAARLVTRAQAVAVAGLTRQRRALAGLAVILVVGPVAVVLQLLAALQALAAQEAMALSS